MSYLQSLYIILCTHKYKFIRNTNLHFHNIKIKKHNKHDPMASQRWRNMLAVQFSGTDLENLKPSQKPFTWF